MDPTDVARRLVAVTERKRPDLYRKILHRMGPHSLDSLLVLFGRHIRNKVDDLALFDRHARAIPEFVWAFVQHARFPTPGDAYGIQLACRITKAETQDTLDSKHLQTPFRTDRFNVERDVRYELDIVTHPTQLFEIASKRRYATVFTRDLSIERLLKRLPNACTLRRGDPYNKALDPDGHARYVTTFDFVLVEDRDCVKILYRSLKDLYVVAKRVPLAHIFAFSDIRTVFKKCGIVSYFFNLMKVCEVQLFTERGSVYEKDVTTLVKYQCRSGIPLPLTRDGLAKNPNRSPLEVLSFEAPKKNVARLCTSPSVRDTWQEVETSADKIFFGEQFDEGTGYAFALLPKTV